MPKDGFAYAWQHCSVWLPNKASHAERFTQNASVPSHALQVPTLKPGGGGRPAKTTLAAGRKLARGLQHEAQRTRVTNPAAAAAAAGAAAAALLPRQGLGGGWQQQHEDTAAAAAAAAGGDSGEDGEVAVGRRRQGGYSAAAAAAAGGGGDPELLANLQLQQQQQQQADRCVRYGNHVQYTHSSFACCSWLCSQPMRSSNCLQAAIINVTMATNVGTCSAADGHTGAPKEC